MKITSYSNIVPLTLLFSLLSVCSSEAAILWQTPTNIYNGATVETFVSTSGTLEAAINATSVTAGGVNATVNGVSFNAADSGTIVGAAVGSGSTLVINGGTNNFNAFGDGLFSNNTPIFNLLRGANFEIGGGVTLGGLIVGQTYQIQIISHDSRNNSGVFTRLSAFGDGMTSGIVTSDGVDLNVQNAANGTGQSIIGTFTATSTDLTFDVFGSTDNGVTFTTGNGAAQINAIQLRLIPEPSSSVLMSLSGLALLARRKR